jgi:hypothetical protein
MMSALLQPNNGLVENGHLYGVSPLKMVISIINLLLGALEPWNFMTFPSYWECHHPN